MISDISQVVSVRKINPKSSVISLKPVWNFGSDLKEKFWILLQAILFNPSVPDVPFWSPWKHQKTLDFLMFSGESVQWRNSDYIWPNQSYIRWTDAYSKFVLPLRNDLNWFLPVHFQNNNYQSKALHIFRNHRKFLLS